MNEQTLRDKLEKLEALFARPGTDGERVAAGLAIERIKARLEEIKKYDPEVEYKFGLRDVWSHMLFLALCRRYGLKPYRYTRQRRTTGHASGACVLCPADLVAGVRRPQPNASRILA